VLLLAASPIHRGILRKVLERPLEMAPGEVYRVSPGGREVLYVAFVVEQWLQSAPRGALVFDSGDADNAVTALAEGWSATVVHMLAREPMTFAELEVAVKDGLAPLIASARLERRNPMEGMSPIDELDDEEGQPRTGVTARIDQGRAVACRPGLDQQADAWAAASAADWLDTVIEPDTQNVRTGGDAWLTKALVEAFHHTLFGIREQAPEE
jgi:hypothetical protein